MADLFVTSGKPTANRPRAAFTGRAARLSRKEFLAELAEYSEALRRSIEAQVDGFTTDPADSARRRQRAQDDYRFFAETYFPHYLTHAPSRFHEFLYEALPRVVADARGLRVAIAAPRGEAKSTLVSLIFVLWCMVTKRKRLIPVIMDAYEQAAVALAEIKAELEVNPRLRQDWAEACGQGPVWREGKIIIRNGAQARAFGRGKRLRGLRHGPFRPDLVILDDLENDENVRSPEQRDKLERWINKAVLRLGPPDGGMDVLYVGTILHYDSVLARMLRNAMWEAHRFKGLIRQPDRMDLWDQWEEALRNSEGDKRAAARAFYEKHEAEMEAGAEVSWPAGRPLYVLMEIRAEDHAAFDSEIQNEPIDDQDAPFQKITYWVQPNNRWLFYGVCDPSLGRRNVARDPSALIVGGFDRETGVLDTVVADIKRRVPDRIIEDIIALQQQWGCLVWWIEAVQFQEFLQTELVKRSAARHMAVPALPYVPHIDKSLRIESIQPHITNGLIRLHPSQTTLIEQLRHWPMADHDDGPDALSALWQLVTGNAPAYGWRSAVPGRMDHGARAGRRGRLDDDDPDPIDRRVRVTAGVRARKGAW
jgi:predicted phage terminase large subunit-like protein